MTNIYHIILLINHDNETSIEKAYFLICKLDNIQVTSSSNAHSHLNFHNFTVLVFCLRAY